MLWQVAVLFSVGAAFGLDTIELGDLDVAGCDPIGRGLASTNRVSLSVKRASLTVVKVHIRHTNLAPLLEAKVEGSSIFWFCSIATGQSRY